MAVCREPNPSQKREVRTMFEPSWTARTCLQEAYECLIPIHRRIISVKPPQGDPAEQPTTQSAELPNAVPRRSVA